MSEGQIKEEDQVSVSQVNRTYQKVVAAMKQAVEIHHLYLHQQAAAGEEGEQEENEEEKGKKPKEKEPKDKKPKDKKREASQEGEEEQGGGGKKGKPEDWRCAGNVVEGTPCPFPPGDAQAVPSQQATRWKLEGDAKAKNHETCKTCKKAIEASKRALKKALKKDEGAGAEEEEEEQKE